MNHETPFGPLEERLTDEAQRMLATEAAGMPNAGRLHSEFLRRRRRRIVFRGVCVSTAVVAIAVIGSTWNMKRIPPEQNGRLAAGTSPPGDTPSRNDSAPPRKNKSTTTPLARDVELPPAALPILIAHTRENGEIELRPGWYVPEQIEAVDFTDLSAAERDAATRLLGLEHNPSGDETI